MTLATLKDMNFNMNEVPAFHESERSFARHEGR
jgi:hypothetical protein